MKALRPWLEAAALLALAAACALVSNALAGPARRLSWRPAALAPPRPAPPPAPGPAGEAPPAAAAAAPPAPRSGPRAPAPAPDPGPDLLARFPPLVDAPQAELPGADALWLHRRGALFVDARRSAAYAQGHIPGARSLPAWEDGLAGKVDQLALFTPDLRAPVVVYCAGGDCQDSHLVARSLWLAGFRNLRIYTDGYPDWEARGGTVARGERP